MNQQKSNSNYLFCVWCTFVDDDSSHVEAHWEDGVLSASITTADDIIVMEVSVFVKETDIPCMMAARVFTW